MLTAIVTRSPRARFAYFALIYGKTFLPCPSPTSFRKNAPSLFIGMNSDEIIAAQCGPGFVTDLFHYFIISCNFFLIIFAKIVFPMK